MRHYTIGTVTRALGWGLLLGGGVGLTVGILLAPEEGSRLRRRITYHLDAVAKNLGAIARQVATPESEAKEHGEAVVAEVRSRAEELNTQMDEIMGAAAQVPASKG